jgi:hypothetical protein
VQGCNWKLISGVVAVLSFVPEEVGQRCRGSFRGGLSDKGANSAIPDAINQSI